MQVELLVKGRFFEVDGAVVKSVGPNVVEITVPLESRGAQRSRRGATAEAWDEAIFVVDGAEAQTAVGCGEGRGSVRVSVVLLDWVSDPRRSACGSRGRRGRLRRGRRCTG